MQGLRKTLEQYFRMTQGHDEGDADADAKRKLVMRDSNALITHLSGLGIYYSDSVYGVPETLVKMVGYLNLLSPVFSTRLLWGSSLDSCVSL